MERSTTRPSWARRLPPQRNSVPLSQSSEAPASWKIGSRAGLVSPSTNVEPGFTMPAFSVAMSVSAGPMVSAWSRLTLVSTATWASATLVASQRPPRPTSTTATSTATSANQRNAAAVRISKWVGGDSSSGSSSATAPMTSARASSGMGSPFHAIRSLTRSRWGLV